MTNDDGTPYGPSVELYAGAQPTYGAGDMLENDGDYREALEQCYGMVWWLADRFGTFLWDPEPTEDRPSREFVKSLIDQAQENYRDGVERGSNP
jgi:hypothetical protein